MQSDKYYRIGEDKPEMPMSLLADEKGSPSSLDALLNQRTGILNTKLEVFAGEISERLRLRRSNMDRILCDELYVGNTILYFDPHEGIKPYDKRLQQVLYQRIFELSKERREQDVECWKDVVMVMRDFLTAWEAHEQAKGRAVFLQRE